MRQPELVDSGAALEAAGLIHRVSRAAGDGPHPTAVLLHGLGGDEDVMWIFARTLPTASGWLVAAPRGIVDDGDGGYSWHARQGEGLPGVAAFAPAAEAVARFVRSLPGLYQADPERIYLMGFSQGAATAIVTAWRYPGLVRGVAALMGFAPPLGEGEEADSSLAGLPVFMAAGLRDTTIPLEAARASAKALRASGVLLEYHEYDAAHKMSAPAMDDLRVWWRTVG